jgi:hypothetical protein
VDISKQDEDESYSTFSFPNGLELVIDWESDTASVLTSPELEDGLVRFDLSDLENLGQFIENSRP